MTVATVLFAWAVWRSVNVGKRAAREVTLVKTQTAANWTRWVEAGIVPDSATQLALGDLRARLQGESPAFVDISFEAPAVLDWAWQARMLNPFYDAKFTLPRTTAENESLRQARADIRYAVAAKRELVRERLGAESMFVMLLATVVLLVVASIIVYRVQRRERESHVVEALAYS